MAQNLYSFTCLLIYHAAFKFISSPFRVIHDCQMSSGWIMNSKNILVYDIQIKKIYCSKCT